MFTQVQLAPVQLEGCGEGLWVSQDVPPQGLYGCMGGVKGSRNCRGRDAGGFWDTLRSW